MVLPLRIDRTGGAGKVQEFNPTSDNLDPRVLPEGSVQVWTDGTSYSLGTNIDHAGRSYVCISSHTADSTNRPDLSSNPDGTDQRWAVVGGGVQRISGETGNISPLNRIGWGEISFDVDASASYSETSFHVESPSGSPLNDARVSLRIPITEGGGFDTAGAGLTNVGSTVSLALYPQKGMLFLGTRGATGTTANNVGSSTKAYLTFTTNGINYFFIRGVNIDTSDANPANWVFADGGAGVWTTDEPTGTITVANSANLIG